MGTKAAAAETDGMALMWELDDGTTDWWSGPGQQHGHVRLLPGGRGRVRLPGQRSVAGIMVKWLGGLGGTYGYYAADDGMLAPGDEGQMDAYVQAIKAQDPAHTVKIGSAPASCYAKLDYPTASQQLKLRNEILTHADPKLILCGPFLAPPAT